MFVFTKIHQDLTKLLPLINGYNCVIWSFWRKIAKSHRNIKISIHVKEGKWKNIVFDIGDKNINKIHHKATKLSPLINWYNCWIYIVPLYQGP